jgi:hypothetical protein
MPTLDHPTIPPQGPLEFADAVGLITSSRKDRQVPLIEFNLITHI